MREPAEETGPNNIPEKEKRTKIINIVYIIAALDITWMFLHFSVTPVSICPVAAQEAEISLYAWTRKLFRKRCLCYGFIYVKYVIDRWLRVYKQKHMFVFVWTH